MGIVGIDAGTDGGTTFLTDDIDANDARMILRGVRFRSPPKRMDWGGWLCEFEDPDGNAQDLKEPAPAP